MKYGEPYKLGDRWVTDVPICTYGIKASTATQKIYLVPALAQYYEAKLRFLQDEECNRETGIARYFREHPDAL